MRSEQIGSDLIIKVLEEEIKYQCVIGPESYPSDVAIYIQKTLLEDYAGRIQTTSSSRHKECVH